MAGEGPQVQLDARQVTIQWQDGHQSRYPHRSLRLRCQCAQCIEEWTRTPLLDPSSVPEEVQAVDHLMVGNYGVQFLWSDGHYTGIYAFEYLRRLCPCPECGAGKLAG